jgi:hypothetical protein
MFIRSALRFVRALRFRSARLRLLTHPGDIGGVFKAEFVIRKVLPRGTTIGVTLINQAINKYHDNQGGRGHASITPVFKSTCDVQIDEMPYRNGSYVIPLEYDIPARAKDETEGSASAGRSVGYRWRLQVKAKLAGADMDIEFPVPIFHIDNSK